MSENNKIADRAEKILFIVCATFLGVLFVFFRFGGMDAMKGKWCRFWCQFCFWGSVITGALFLIFAGITMFVCCCGDDGCVPCCERPFLRKFRRAEEWNKTYWVDSSNIEKEIPKGRTIIFVKDDADFRKIKFAKPGKISEIYFCASELKVSAKQLRKLKCADFFLDCGKTKITIETDKGRFEAISAWFKKKWAAVSGGGDNGGGGVPCRECPCLRKFTGAEEQNRTYWVDSSNMNDKIPKGRTIIFVKDDADFRKIKFAKPGKISEIHFCASEQKVSAKQLRKLKCADFFLDCGKTKITIETAAQESADGGADSGGKGADAAQESAVGDGNADSGGKGADAAQESADGGGGKGADAAQES